MIERMRPAVAPAYLFLCLLLGGSPQGMWGNAILQLLGVILIAWALIERRNVSLPRGARPLFALAGAAILLVLAQLIPLPPNVWSALPGREIVLRGHELLGLERGPMPISLAPYDSLGTVLAVLPSLGMLAAMLCLKTYKPTWLVAALVAGTMAGVLLGILQVSSPNPLDSAWYPYRISNFGVATGFFANSNHMASLLLVTIPFIAAAGAWLHAGSKDVRAQSAALALAGGGLAVVILGLLLNRSLAGYGLALPVVLLSLLMLLGRKGPLARGGVLIVGLISVVVVVLLWTSPVGSKLSSPDAATSVASRQEILSGSMTLVGRFGAVGSGLGTFPKIYPLGEDPTEIDRYYVNHAHNDYVELAIELGLPGVILLLVFIGWWVLAVWRMLRSPSSDEFAMAGAIASAAVLLHSSVDYPLRTAAIAVIFAMSLALVLQSRRSARSASDLRPVRHVVVG